MYAYVAQQQYIEDGLGRFFAFSLLIVSVILEFFIGILIFVGGASYYLLENIR